jgi:hypothetical protein
MALEILEVVAILGTRSFTIPIHTNYGYYAYGYAYGSYDQPVYQGSGGYTDSLIGRSPAPSGSCSVSGSGTRRSIREYERAHSLPEDGKIGQQLLTTMGLS